MTLAMHLLERDLVPDERLREEDQHDPELQQNRLMAFVRKLTASPVAIETAAANRQHYEVPTEFYQRVLGKHSSAAAGAR
jgi:cyclopropane-fatty-acyl-phospholipid synthase